MVVLNRGNNSNLLVKFLSCIFACVMFTFGGMGAANADAKFTLTTTSGQTTFSWQMTAVGEFTVDCGDGGTLSSSASDVSGNTITRTGTSSATYTCTWGSAGAHTISFDGTATDYSTSISTAAILFYVNYSSENSEKIASISGNLSSMFPYISGNGASGAQPRFVSTFTRATNLKSIPATLFADYTSASVRMFWNTFSRCTGLTSIPENLFFPNATSVSGADYMFWSTFENCTGLTSIPAGLFSKITSGADYMFQNTFYGCTGLTSIPAGLFSKITSGADYMFDSTFLNCTGLTSIPENLFFPNATSVSGADYMFRNTFYGCTGLTSIPENLFFPNATSVSGADHMFYGTFYQCTGLTSIPAGLFSKITSGASHMFDATFSHCTGLTSIPAGLFSKITSGADYMFSGTFSSCTGLTSIPENLFFPNATSVSGADRMFGGTFSSCTGLTSIPAGLFSKITSGASYMFGYTFNGCTNLGCENTGCSTGTGYIPPSTFAGLSANGSPTAANMWNNAFSSTKLVTSCPSGTTQYITGYEGTDSSTSWNGKVSCTNGTDGYGVIYSCGDGSGTPPTDSNRYASGVTALANTCTAPSGKEFRNWLCGGNTVAAGGTFTISSDTTCTAQWGNPVTVTYACGDGSGTPPTDSNNPYISGLTVTTLANTCTAPSGKGFSNWSCGGNTVVAGGTFTISSDTTCTAQYSTPKFTLTTTSGQTTFSWQMTAVGEFTVDCGDGGTLSSSASDVSGNTITRTGTSQAMYTCIWEAASAHTISFYGTATDYSTSTSRPAISFRYSAQMIASISGNLSSMFPYINGNEPDGAQPRFYRTFSDARNLNSIPATLFADYTSASTGMFQSTFQMCTGLTSIPAGLFSKITSGASYMFGYTFNGCTNLGCENTGCSTGTGYIPPSTFAGLSANGSPTAANMWNNAFSSTKLVTSCPSGTTQYITGYEGTDSSTSWNGKVSCTNGTDGYGVIYSCGDGAMGTAPTDDKRYASGLTVTSANNTCTKSGNIFTGWSCGGNTVAPDGTFTISGDTTCTAQWNACTACTGNTGVSCSLSVSNNTCTYATSCNTGYSNIQNNGAYNASCGANTINITWQNENGTTLTTNSCTYGDAITIPEAPHKTGYKFTGWTVVSQ